MRTDTEWLFPIKFLRETEPVTVPAPSNLSPGSFVTETSSVPLEHDFGPPGSTLKPSSAKFSVRLWASLEPVSSLIQAY